MIHPYASIRKPPENQLRVNYASFTLISRLSKARSRLFEMQFLQPNTECTHFAAFCRELQDAYSCAFLESRPENAKSNFIEAASRAKTTPRKKKRPESGPHDKTEPQKSRKEGMARVGNPEKKPATAPNSGYWSAR